MRCSRASVSASWTMPIRCGSPDGRRQRVGRQVVQPDRLLQARAAAASAPPSAARRPCGRRPGSRARGPRCRRGCDWPGRRCGRRPSGKRRRARPCPGRGAVRRRRRLPGLRPASAAAWASRRAAHATARACFQNSTRSKAPLRLSADRLPKQSKTLVASTMLRTAAKPMSGHGASPASVTGSAHAQRRRVGDRQDLAP